MLFYSEVSKKPRRITHLDIQLQVSGPTGTWLQVTCLPFRGLKLALCSKTRQYSLCQKREN